LVKEVSQKIHCTFSFCIYLFTFGGLWYFRHVLLFILENQQHMVAVTWIGEKGVFPMALMICIHWWKNFAKIVTAPLSFCINLLIFGGIWYFRHVLLFILENQQHMVVMTWIGEKGVFPMALMICIHWWKNFAKIVTEPLSFCIYLLFLVVYGILGMYYFSYLKISNTWLHWLG